MTLCVESRATAHSFFFFLEMQRREDMEAEPERILLRTPGGKIIPVIVRERVGKEFYDDGEDDDNDSHLGAVRMRPEDETELGASWGAEPIGFVTIQGDDGPYRVPCIPIEELGHDW